MIKEAQEIQTDLLLSDHFTVDPTLEAFGERTLAGNVTLKFEMQNLTHSPERRFRELYLVNRIDGLAYVGWTRMRSAAIFAAQYVCWVVLKRPTFSDLSFPQDVAEPA